jgi:hypothetical protein
MRTDRLGVLAIVAAALLAGACASGEEWQTWKEHPTHFASGEHMMFSVRNRTGEPVRVTREDIALARTQGWWGKAITVSTEQILER